MLALYGAGRQSDALALYQSVRTRLKADLGLEPSPTLRDTERRILTQDVSLAPEPTRLRSVIVAPARVEQLAALAALAEPLARARFPHELILACLAEATEDESAESALERAITAARDQQSALANSGADIRTAVFTTADRPGDLLHLAARAEVDLVLLGVDAGDVAEGRFGSGLLPILKRATCDVAFATGESLAGSASEILVPFGAREHDWAALGWAPGWPVDGRPLVLLGTDAGDGVRDASRLLAIPACCFSADQRGRRAAPRRLGTQGLAEPRRTGLLVMGTSDRWFDEVSARCAGTSRA
jgi:hypothetical protein